MSGILPDSVQHTADAKKIRAELVMLAARDVANRCMKHALDLRENGEPAVADIFETNAGTFRSIERAAGAEAALAAE